MVWIEWEKGEYRPQDAKGLRARVVEIAASLNMRYTVQQSKAERAKILPVGHLTCMHHKP